MSHLVGHGLPSQDVINATEGSFIHTRKRTQTDMLQQKQLRTEGERRKKQTMIITSKTDLLLSGWGHHRANFLITNRLDDCDVVVWSLCKLPEYFVLRLAWIPSFLFVFRIPRNLSSNRGPAPLCIQERRGRERSMAWVHIPTALFVQWDLPGWCTNWILKREQQFQTGTLTGHLTPKQNFLWLESSSQVRWLMLLLLFFVLRTRALVKMDYCYNKQDQEGCALLYTALYWYKRAPTTSVDNHHPFYCGAGWEISQSLCHS